MIAEAKPEVPLGLSRDEKHRYSWRDEAGTIANIASVTKVVGILEKPGLVPGASRILAQYATTQTEDVLRLVQAVGYVEATKKLARLPREEWDRAADLGSRVHTLCELILRGREVVPRPDEEPYIAGLYRFIERAQPMPLALEEMVAYEDELGIAYAGTFDAVLQMADGRWLVDFKTGKEIYDDTALQLAGYAYASFIGRPGDLTRYSMPEVDAFAVLHLNPKLPDGYAFTPYEVGRVEWLRFMALLDVWDWQHTKRAKRERLEL